MKVETLLQSKGITPADVAALQNLIRSLGQAKPVANDPGELKPECPPTTLRPPQPTETIFIPPEFRGQPITASQVSTRLGHILAYKAIRVLGDLHGLSYRKLLEFRNCGKKTMAELREIVWRVQCQAPSGMESPLPNSTAPSDNDWLLIPDHSQGVRLSDLDLSVRLANVLAKLRFKRLGALHDRHFGEFQRQRNVGKTTMAELRRLAARAQAGEFNPGAIDLASLQPARVVPLLEKLLAQLPDRQLRDIFRFRFGAEQGQFPTLREIGSRFGVSGERIRQIVDLQLDRMRKQGGPTLRHLLGQMALDGGKAVCPLTPDLLVAWLKSAGTPASCPPSFYLRLLEALSPAIPIWPTGQNQTDSRADWDDEVRRILKAGLQEGRYGLPLPEVFASLRRHRRFRKLTPGEFLDGLRTSSRFRVVFSDPHRPVLHLDHVNSVGFARLVLLASDKPLRAEEIVARAQAQFGVEQIQVTREALANSLTPKHGFYLLGPRAFGLRHHFLLPQRLWKRARADCARFLAQENRPVSTREIIHGSGFPWTRQTNAYELAQILREDETFVDLGRFLYALATWGVTERAFIADLIPQVLAEAGGPLKASQVLEGLTRLRSFYPNNIYVQLRRHPLVREVSPRCFALKNG